MKKTALPIAFLALAAATMPVSLPAKVDHLLPRPQQVELQDNAATFILGRNVSLSDTTANAQLEAFLTETNCTIDATATASVCVELVDSVPGAYDFTLAGFPNEAYTLTISENEIRITAASETGVTRAAQTLMQLAQGWDGESAQLEALTLTDWPAFKVRGFMHDVGRSFVSVDQLKRQIDLLARFKLNLFHWHLTENQAWRFEVKQYPQLTESSNMTRFAGQYYTQEQCKEVQDYAWERGMVIIPEIDMPGHSEAFERAMGHSMQTDQGVEELQNILEEVAEVFDKAPYIHIGADEETITYANFLETMIAKVHALDRKVMVWNPISGVNIASLDVDMTQMWSSSGSAISGMANLDCRYNYTNHFDVFADLVGIYKSNIYYKTQGDATVPGFISAPWNDRKTPSETDILRQNNVYANTIACGERAWIGGGEQYIETGGTVLPNSGSEYDEFADWERRFLWHKANTFGTEADLVPYVKQTNVRWRITDAMPNGGDASAVLPPETEGIEDSYEIDGTTYATLSATGAGIYLRHTWGTTVPSLFSNPQTNTTAYAWTYVYSPVEQTAGALIEFQNYGRSENDSAPDEGNWDRKGSRLWLNDEEILPPTWTNTGVSITSEVDLGNENFTARAPEQVTLKEGWNKVFLKLPYVSASGVRLNKWMFTFVLTDVEGGNALDGLVYSPGQYLDETAEQVSSAIADARQWRNQNIADVPGFYPDSIAAELDETLTQIENTLHDDMSTEEREAQLEQIADILNQTQAAAEQSSRVLPTASTDTDIYAYTLSTPLRNGYYVTSQGAGCDAQGTAEMTDESKWKFVHRTSIAYDIVNLVDSTYLSPLSSENTAITTTKNRPAMGWKLGDASEVGYLIIYNGTRQLNQTNAGNSYKIFNWGSGTNTTDTGCQFAIRRTSLPDILSGVEEVGATPSAAEEETLFDLTGRRVDDNYRGLVVTQGRKTIKR